MSRNSFFNLIFYRKDVFLLSCKDLGNIMKVKLRHDGARKNTRWHLSKVRILIIRMDFGYNTEAVGPILTSKIILLCNETGS